MASHYEVRKDGAGIDVVGFSKLFESREVAETVATRDSDAPVARVCPECGQTYTADELKMLFDLTGCDDKCEHDGFLLVAPNADGE